MRYGNFLVNLLTLFVLMAALVSIGLTTVIFVDPQLPINPYRPPAIPTRAVLPSPTLTVTFSQFSPIAPTSTSTLPPTSTHTPTLAPTDTPDFSPTPEATATLDETQIAQLTAGVVLEPTNTSAPTFTRTPTRSAFPFTLQGPPLPSRSTHGCNWMGIGGQAYDLEGNPIAGYWVHLTGGGLDVYAATGSPSAIAYGPGGYEIFLNNHPVQTVGEYKIQLFESTQKFPMSDIVGIDTYADCDKNVLLVYFVQDH